MLKPIDTSPTRPSSIGYFVIVEYRRLHGVFQNAAVGFFSSQRESFIYKHEKVDKVEMTGGPTGINAHCPICGESMSALSESSKPENVGINQLRTHIRSATGDGHGQQGQIPDWITEDLLEEHVQVSEVIPTAPA